MQRRSFVQRLGAVTVALAAAPVYAMEPLVRPQPGQLRLSLAAYSMRKYLQSQGGQSAQMDLFDFVDFCHDQGLTGAELTSYYFPQDVDDDYLRKLKRHCHLRGISVSGGAIRNDFCSSDVLNVAQDLAHTKQWIDHYALLGAPAIRIFAGKEVAGEELSTTLRRCAKICEVAAAYAEEKGVLLAIENHGGVTAEAEGLLGIVRQVDSPAFGVNFDSGGFRSADPYAELAMIAPYAVNAQIKVQIDAAGKKQDTDMARVLGMLRDVGYSGWVALEYEADEEPREAIPTWLAKMKKLVDA
ncbi:MAG: sugar phosphate isomerase/epimerase [Planctomycetales bacterium]|nr:sugar phosphate isomerase/epimerase [Planctomycetales bacterium]